MHKVSQRLMTSFYLRQLEMGTVDTKTLQETGVKNSVYSKALQFTLTGWPE